jgi:CRISPR-associated protein Cpf1
MEKEKDFSQFTGLYEISKTLRFELKPVGGTQEFLEKDWIIQKDREVEKNYNKIKVFFDTLHREFVKQSLENWYLNEIENFYNAYIGLNKDLENKKNKTLQKDFEKASKNLKKEFVSFFESKWNEWKQKYSFLKKWWIDVLNEKEVLDLMAEFSPEQKELFKKFDKFFTYFTNFKESRKNFYADDWRAWAVATRAIDENLITFIKNIEDFKKFQNNFPDFVENIFNEDERQVFELDFYNNCLLQDGIDNYNKILWWYSLETWNKVQWINEKINLFKQNQTHSNSKDIKFPRFKLLYKQILSEKEKTFFIDEIENDEKLLEFIKWSLSKNKEKIQEANKIIENFIENNEAFELDKIYFSKVSINTISNKYFVSWDYIRWYFDKWEIWDFVSFEELKSAFEKITYENLEDVFKNNYISENIVLKSQGIFKNFLNIFFYEFRQNISGISLYTSQLESLIWEKFEKSEKQVEVIKNYFDSVLSLYKMTKYFALEKGKNKVEEFDTDNNFYNDFYEYYNEFEIWKDYNLVRNFLTKKQVSMDKFKLNFNNSQFLTGWDKDKEKERLWLILKKDWKYFLWILKNNKVFDIYKYKTWDFYEKMNYKQLNNVYRQLPRFAFSNAKREIYWITSELEKIKEEFDIFQKNKEKWEKFDLVKLRKLIDCYKKWFIATYENEFDLEKIKNTDYTDLSSFYDDIEKKTYKLHFSKIDLNFIEEKVNSWDLYLFQIYNKDFSETKKAWSKENIHTKYFKLLFDEKNLENLVIKLSGWAEIFFRDKTDKLKQKTRLLKDSETSSEWQEEKIFFIEKNWEKKEVLDHRRYAQDKIMLHLSITLNANRWDKYWFNKEINEFLVKKEDIKIIWIDRGEKHLAYYSVIDKTWKIYEIDTLNRVNWVDYLEKLEKIETARKDARVSWWEIENIKELKNGYISQVVNKIAELIIKYNAIIIFEDLNMWFKRWRQKIERQIYQKLELALAKKLNYLTQKDKKDDEVLWNLKALQLVPRVSDYQDISNYKQSWIMFYTRANYTSTTCPVCGFRKNIYISNSDTKEKQKKAFEKINIQFDGEKFVFSYEIEQDKKVKQVSNRTKFIVNSDVFRLKYNSKKMLVEEIDLNIELKKLFKDIDLTCWNINKQISEKDSYFYKSLTYFFNLILQLRNSDSKNDIDYITCPNCHYHSKDWFQGLPYNADANWAYNIARKWIIMLKNIKINHEKPDLYVSDIDWDNFTQKIQ